MATEATFITALKSVFVEPPLKVEELRSLTSQDREYFCDLLESEKGFKITNRAQAIASGKQ